MTGLTYNGKDANGNALWDSCANIRIRNYEKGSTCEELILAFNINTNRWMAKSVSCLNLSFYIKVKGVVVVVVVVVVVRVCCGYLL